MADTGAPWNLPYPLATDLVRDGAQAIQDLAEAVADELAAGIGSNAVSAVKTDTFSTTSTTFEDVPGLSVTITPSSDMSKVLVIASVNVGPRRRGGFVRLLRSGSLIYVGDASGNRVQSAIGTGETNTGDFEGILTAHSIVFLDSPGTTSATTYKLQFAAGGASDNNAHINRSHRNDDNSRHGLTPSSITAIEVAA